MVTVAPFQMELFYSKTDHGIIISTLVQETPDSGIIKDQSVKSIHPNKVLGNTNFWSDLEESSLTVLRLILSLER